VVDRIGINGEVVVQITVKGREIVEVKPLSGPREYYRPVQAAVRRFQCTSASAADPQVTMLTIGFRLE
jgi:protein TonB